MDMKSMNMDWKSIFVVDLKPFTKRDSKWSTTAIPIVLWDFYASNACDFVSMALLHSHLIPRGWI